MNIQLQGTEAGPVYAQVRTQIEALIQNKQVRSGETLPSPATLAQQLSVDRGEIQRAYYELEQSGLVIKKTGKDFLGNSKVSYTVK
ncbi:MAG: GntR family transcriptional regulator [Pyrinomonadaceae bacterium]|nr:GntR family transcriptional regulator [Pyrinomonadaceae bacterium]